MDARTGIKPPETAACRRWGWRRRRLDKAIALSPLNKRRWENFKANRRGYWSLWIFLALFLVSLFAEFIANDKPIFIHVNGRLVFPGRLHLSRHGLCQRSRIRTCSAQPRTIVTII